MPPWKGIKLKIEILGTPFNGLGKLPEIENPAEGLRLAKLIHLLEANDHHVTDLGDLSGFLCQEIRDPEPGGFTFEEANKLLGLIWARSRVIGMSIVCYHPVLDEGGQAGRRLAALVSEVIVNQSIRKLQP